MSEFEAVIGLEIHVESKTKSKMFCGCENGLGLESEPNIHICPVCTGHPGTLPVTNREALKGLIKFGNALQCKISDYTWFERKSYFYPDLPKGYQITQYERPLCYEGVLKVETSEGEKDIRITRIHMEEDTGKLNHKKGTEYSHVDYNRAGVPLMEMVTEPDIRNAEEAKAFCQEIQTILRYLEVSDADMEKGQMRCEVNISLRPKGAETFGTKVEVKNLNSFTAVARSIEYEIERQAELLRTNPEEIVQETRGWDDSRGVTFSQRKKENAHDYRYFLEPDIPPFHTEELKIEADREMTELPAAKRKRFKQEYGIDSQAAATLTTDKKLAHYFEYVISELEAWYNATHDDVDTDTLLANKDFRKLVKLAQNYLLTELTRMQYSEIGTFDTHRITPENFAEFVTIVKKGTVSSSGAQTLLAKMFETGGDPSEILESENLTQVSDESAMDEFVSQAIEANAKVVEDYKSGNENAIQFLVGQVMKFSRGKANPQVARQMLQERLK
jgi:aspartyl-tRNA(Asn)/glutamyl-tRNA(Gln) amidotransferase subunit B